MTTVRWIDRLGEGGFGFRWRLAVLLAAATVLSVVLAVGWLRQDDSRAERPTLSQLAAKNYRILSRTETLTLIRYAESEYQCLVSHGAHVSRPVASRTRILIRAPNQSAHVLARLELGCDPDVGPPPGKSDLQARQGQVLIYVPKQCLINPAELPRS
jgi:hypothetical protein